MLFKRRQNPGAKERFQAWIWPRRGWRRAWNYVLHRVKRLSGSPHAIALGFAAGAFASFTPFVGFHFLLGFLVAYLVGGNLIASALGTFVGNPLTFPFIWFATYTLGSLMLGIELDQAATSAMPVIELGMLWTDWGQFWLDFWDKIWPVIKPMLVAGVPMGIAVGAICYWLVKIAVSAYQTKRRSRIEANGVGKKSPKSQAEETSL
jgi:uncharacterized protein (DUF2062 family)